jgi:hypothetical protein
LTELDTIWRSGTLEDREYHVATIPPGERPFTLFQPLLTQTTACTHIVCSHGDSPQYCSFSFLPLPTNTTDECKVAPCTNRFMYPQRPMSDSLLSTGFTTLPRTLSPISTDGVSFCCQSWRLSFTGRPLRVEEGMRRATRGMEKGRQARTWARTTGERINLKNRGRLNAALPSPFSQAISIAQHDPRVIKLPNLL